MLNVKKVPKTEAVMGFLSSVSKIGKKVGSALKKVGQFAGPLLNGPLGGPLKGMLGGLMQKLGPVAQKLLDSPIGKLAQKLVPNLAQKVQDFLNPAKLGAMFGGAQSPNDFAQLLGPALRNVPILGDLLK
jgi:hypothetical protein